MKTRYLIVELITGFTGPWFVMLALGDIHRFASVVPLLTYWTVFWPVNLLVTILDQVGHAGPLRRESGPVTQAARVS